MEYIYIDDVINALTAYRETIDNYMNQNVKDCCCVLRDMIESTIQQLIKMKTM